MKFTKRIKKELIFDTLLLFFVVFSVAKYYKNNNLLFFLIAIAWLVAVMLWHTKKDVYFFIIGGIIGPISEIICIYFGAWSYANPSFLGIPIWLPFLWGSSVMMVNRVAQTLIKLKI